MSTPQTDVVKVAEEKAEAATSLFVKKNAEREHLGDAREDVLWWSLFDVMLAAVKEAEAARHQAEIERRDVHIEQLQREIEWVSDSMPTAWEDLIVGMPDNSYEAVRASLNPSTEESSDAR